MLISEADTTSRGLEIRSYIAPTSILARRLIRSSSDWGSADHALRPAAGLIALWAPLCFEVAFLERIYRLLLQNPDYVLHSDL
jgi:hypothetical protein